MIKRTEKGVKVQTGTAEGEERQNAQIENGKDTKKESIRRRKQVADVTYTAPGKVEVRRQAQISTVQTGRHA